MQLASHGIPRLVARGVPQKSSRGIHIPTFIRTPPGSVSSGTVQRILQHSKTLVTRFFIHLTTPGISSPSLLTRPIHAAARGHNSIRNGLSLPVRMALSRPLQAPFLPRAPAIPRGITQVGLGTARNFSSARPIFQNLAQNVPVTGRALWEADWELKIRKERGMAKPRKNRSKKEGRKATMKPKLERILQDKLNAPEQSAQDAAELDHYFPAPQVPEVTTYLLIPLAPTPTSRLPMHSLPSDYNPLLPLSTLASLHASHATHSLRVSSLFARLDTANVWSRGVTCSAYSHGQAVGDGEGACTILKIGFVGWTRAEVRSVIGESGTGWCVLEECRREMESEGDETSSIFSGRSDDLDGLADAQRVKADAVIDGIDPAESFILPTLDFSSDFISATSSDLSDSEIDMLSGSDLDAFSDTDWDVRSQSSNESGANVPWVQRPSSRHGWFVFSSDFASKTSAPENEPREYLF